MTVEYLPKTEYVDENGINISDRVEQDEKLMRYVLENYKTFYICAQQTHSPFQNHPVSDAVMKVRLLAPNRLAAEKAAQRLNASFLGRNYHHWIEPV